MRTTTSDGVDEPSGQGRLPAIPHAEELVRIWTTTGALLYDHERATREGHSYATGPDVLTAAIDTLTWQTLAPGQVVAVPFSPGEGIRTLIADTGLTQVSAIAWNGALKVHDDAEHASSLYGLYGIDAVHCGFRVRIYAVDRGTDLLEAAVDVPTVLATALGSAAGLGPTL